jgi:hypothetical protein
MEKSSETAAIGGIRRWTEPQVRCHLAGAARYLRKKWGWGASIDLFSLSEAVRQEFLEDYETYVRAIRRAAKYPLSRSLIVRKWIAGQQSVRDYSVLRDLGIIGMETGYSGGIDPADMWIAMNIDQFDGTLDDRRPRLLDLLNSGEWPGWLKDPTGDAFWKDKVRTRLKTKQQLWKRLDQLGIRTTEE